MAAKRPGRKPRKPMPLMGAAAFGYDALGDPVGSQAIGGPSESHPLRGALLFGNDPRGNARGSEAFGNPDEALPLRGALLVGNDPEGNPRGSEAFGGSERKVPLKGALLFGNDPDGEARGSESIGQATAALQFRGAMAFGAPQLVPDTLYRDAIGYDFGGVLLHADDATLAGIRRDARDRIRQRVLAILRRRLDVEVERLRHGLNEHSIKWGRLRNRRSQLDRALAEDLRRWYRKAPGEVLGIGHVRDLLEESERMHTFTLRCAWDCSPVTLSVVWAGEVVAEAETQHHKEHSYLVFKDSDGVLLGYADRALTGDRAQAARVRDIHGKAVGSVVFSSLAQDGALVATLVDGCDRVLCELHEHRLAPDTFVADLVQEGEPVGGVEDRLGAGVVACHVELDLGVPQVMAWAFGAILADLARLRRAGWPARADSAEPVVESIEEALGPPRQR